MTNKDILLEKILENPSKLSYLFVLTKEDEETWNANAGINKVGYYKRLVGNQLKYIISWENEIIACFGVVSAAFAIKDRDNFIGWSYEEKEKNLKYIVRLQCYYIFCEPLNIYYCEIVEIILSNLVKRISLDFKSKYKYEPLLIEYFVDVAFDEMSNILLKTGWKYAGVTLGQGRSESIINEKKRKYIFLFIYDSNFRKIFALKKYEEQNIDSVLPKDTLDLEFSDSNIGDKRRNKTLIDLANLKYKFMGLSIPKMCEGRENIIKKIYRFLDNKSNDINFDSIQACHRANTIKRMCFSKRVMVVVDATDLNYENLIHCSGLGIIGVKKGGSTSKGIRLYTAMAFDEHWLPLGIVYSTVLIPKLRTEDQKKSNNIPQEEKETQIWIDLLKILVTVKNFNPDLKITYIADRGADFFNLFTEYIKHVDIEIIIRAKHNRILEDHKKLFETVKQEKIVAKNEIRVQRLSSRSLDDPGRISRVAELSMRAKCINIPSTDKKNKEFVPLNIIYVSEENPPLGVKKLEWYILTSESIETRDNILRIVEKYAGRWHIEIWHKILKTDGCNVENFNHRSVESLERNLSIDMVIAWHAMLFRDYGMYYDDFSSEATFKKLERLIMEKYAAARHLDSPITHKNGLILQASLGGYLDRNETIPGYRSIKDGTLRLSDKVDGYIMGIEEVIENLNRILSESPEKDSIPKKKIEDLILNLGEILK